MFAGVKPKRRSRLALPRPRASAAEEKLVDPRSSDGEKRSSPGGPISPNPVSSSPLQNDHDSNTRQSRPSRPPPQQVERYPLANIDRVNVSSFSSLDRGVQSPAAAAASSGPVATGGAEARREDILAENSKRAPVGSTSSSTTICSSSSRPISTPEAEIDETAGPPEAWREGGDGDGATEGKDKGSKGLIVRAPLQTVPSNAWRQRRLWVDTTTCGGSREPTGSSSSCSSAGCMDDVGGGPGGRREVPTPKSEWKEEEEGDEAQKSGGKNAIKTSIMGSPPRAKVNGRQQQEKEQQQQQPPAGRKRRRPDSLALLSSPQPEPATMVPSLPREGNDRDPEAAGSVARDGRPQGEFAKPVEGGKGDEGDRDFVVPPTRAASGKVVEIAAAAARSGDNGRGAGELCPVCGSAVWGLGVRARQVHINSCLDGIASSDATGGEGVGGAAAGMSGEIETRVASGAQPGRRSSTGVARVPKTEFQENIQMAKALSRSLAVAAPAAADAPEDSEELARDPAAFRAKEKRLLGTLKELDLKLERLNKERDLALKKLAAHRALGVRVSAGTAAARGENFEGAPKTAEEVVDSLFPEERDNPDEHVSTTSRDDGVTGRAGRRGKGRNRKASPLPGISSPPNNATERSPALETDRGAGLPAPEVPGGDREGECGDCGSSDGGGGSDESVHATGSPKLTRRRSSGGGCSGVRGRVSSSKGRTLWGIAQEAEELSQSKFLTGVFADVRAETEATTARGHGRQRSRAATVTAAAYDEVSRYNRRSTRSAAADDSLSASLTNPAAIESCPESPPEIYDAEKRISGSAGAVGSGAGKRRRGNDKPGVEGVSLFGNDDNATDEAISLLSQTLSDQRARAPLTPVAPSAEAEIPGMASGSEVEKVVARHIALAPLAAVSRLFPEWEENVRFVFGQSAAELRDALESIDAALSEEEAAAATAAAAGDARSLGRKERRETETGEEGVEDAAARRSGKAEALLFFEGVILEALELKTSDESPTTSTERKGCGHGDAERVLAPRVGGCGSGGGRSEQRGGDRGDPPQDPDGMPEAGDPGEDGETNRGVDDGDRASLSCSDGPDFNVSAACATAEAALDSVINADFDPSAPAGDRPGVEELGLDGGGSLEAKRGDLLGVGAACAKAADEDDCETIVLSGDSCCDAIVTFDLTSSEASKHPGAPGATPSALEPPRSPAGSRHTGADMMDATQVADGSVASSREAEGVGGEEEGASGTDLDEEDFAWNDLSAMPSSDCGTAQDPCAPPSPFPSPPPSPPGDDEQRSPSGVAQRRRQCRPPIADLQQLEGEETPPVDVPEDFLLHPPPPASRVALPGPEPRPRGGGVSSAAGFSLTQNAPSRGCSETGSAAPPRSLSQPVGVRQPPAGAGGVGRGAASGDGRGGEAQHEVMPEFEKMTLQELVGMMAVYGLKKKPKREMVERLEHIWKALHPAAADVTGGGIVAPGDAGALSAPGVPRVRCPSSSQGRAGTLARSSTAPAVGFGRPPLARPRDARGGRPVRFEGGEAPPSPPSRKKRAPRAPAASKDKEALGEQIRAVITGHAQLHEDIILLRTIDLSATQFLLKEHGLKCSKRDLSLYLDDRGITFVDRGMGGEVPARKKLRAAGRAGAGGGSASQT